MTQNQNPWQDNTPAGTPDTVPVQTPVPQTQPQVNSDPEAHTAAVESQPQVQPTPAEQPATWQTSAPDEQAPATPETSSTPGGQPSTWQSSTPADTPTPSAFGTVAPAGTLLPQDDGVIRFFKHHVRTVAQSIWLYLLSSNLLSFLFSILFSVFLQAYAVWASTNLTNAEWGDFMTTWYSVFEYGIALVGSVAASLLTVWFAKSRSKVKVRSLFSGPFPSITYLLACVPVTMLCNFAGGTVSQWIAYILSFFGIYPNSLNDIPVESMPGMILFILMACVAAPILEELIFRGVLLRILGRYHVVMAAVVTSLLFSLLHGSWLSIPATFLVGMFLSLVTIRTGNLKLAILLHMINNILSVLQSLVIELTSPTSLVYLGFVLCVNVALPILGVISLILMRRKLRFECGDPHKANYCNILTVERPYRLVFKNGWVISLLVALFIQSVVYTIFL